MGEKTVREIVEEVFEIKGDDKMKALEKLMRARVELQGKDLKKSGHNKFANFKYYELGDFLPTINEINKELGIIPIFNMDGEIATLTVYNTENFEDKVEFLINFVDAELKGATKIQEHGATQTYLKRYLYLNAYEIVEGDVVDAQKPDDNQEKPSSGDSKKATKAQVDKLKKLAQSKGISDQRMLEKYGAFIYSSPFTNIYEKALKEVTDHKGK